MQEFWSASSSCKGHEIKQDFVMEEMPNGDREYIACISEPSLATVLSLQRRRVLEFFLAIPGLMLLCLAILLEGNVKLFLLQ